MNFVGDTARPEMELGQGLLPSQPQAPGWPLPSLLPLLRTKTTLLSVPIPSQHRSFPSVPPPMTLSQDTAHPTLQDCCPSQGLAKRSSIKNFLKK